MLSVYPNFVDSKDTIVEKNFKYLGLNDLNNIFKLPLYNGTGNYIFPIRFNTQVQIKSEYYHDDGTFELISTGVDDDYIIPIPKNVVDDTHAGNCIIVIDATCETFDITHSNPRSRVKNFISLIANQYKFSKNQILICTGNLTPYRDLEYATVAVLYVWGRVPKYDYSKMYLESIVNKKNRSNKILLLMNRPYIHRVELGDIIYKKNLRQGNLISLNLNNKTSNYARHLLKKFDNKFINSLPWITDLTNRHIYKGAMYLNTHDELMMYNETYINIVSETFVDNTSSTNSMYEKDISEKTFKPITQLQPFLIYGQVGILTYLKSIGYKTFNSWWDESYDTISDKKLRLEKIIEIIERLNNMSHSQLADMMYEMLPVLEHNMKHHYRLIETGFYTSDFYNTLNKLFVINNDSTI